MILTKHNSLLSMFCTDTYCCCSGKTIKNTFSQAASRVIESGGCVAYIIHIQTLLQFHVNVHDAISPFDSNIGGEGKSDLHETILQNGKEIFTVAVASNLKQTTSVHLSKILEVAMGAEHSTVRYCYKGEAIPFCVGVCVSRYFFHLAATPKRKTRQRRQKQYTRCVPSSFFLPPCALLTASTFYQYAPSLYTASTNLLTPLIFVLGQDNDLLLHQKTSVLSQPVRARTGKLINAR